MASADPQGQGDDRREDEKEDDERKRQQRQRGNPGKNLQDKPELTDDSRKRDSEKDTRGVSENPSQETETRTARKKSPRQSQQHPPGSGRSSTGEGASRKAEDTQMVSHSILFLPRPPLRRFLSDSPTRRSRGSATPRPDAPNPDNRSPDSQRRIRELPRWWDDPPQGQFPLPDIQMENTQRQMNENIQQDLTHRTVRVAGRTYRPVPSDKADFLKHIIDNLPSSPGPGETASPKLSLISSVSLRTARPLPDTKLQYQNHPCGQGASRVEAKPREKEEEDLGAVGGEQSPRRYPSRRQRCFSGPCYYPSWYVSAPVDYDEKKEDRDDDRQEGSSTEEADGDSETPEKNSEGHSQDF